MVLLRLEKHVRCYVRVHCSQHIITPFSSLFFLYLYYLLLPLFFLSSSSLLPLFFLSSSSHKVDFPLEGLDLSTYVGGMPGVDQVTIIIYNIYNLLSPIYTIHETPLTPLNNLFQISTRRMIALPCPTTWAEWAVVTTPPMSRTWKAGSGGIWMIATSAGSRMKVVLHLPLPMSSSTR